MRSHESRVASRDANQDPPRGPATRDSRLSMRPAQVCSQLLAALEASEGRRRQRKRNTTPDSIGLTIKRGLLESAVRCDPDPDDFEGWLLERCESSAGGSGPARAMALDVLTEWRLAQTSERFRSWLEHGAPSADADAGGSG
jgi:hypothetical protein